jgi:hypothetical protein
LKMARQIVMRGQIDHCVARSNAGAQVVHAIRLVRVVFIVANVSARNWRSGQG